MINLNRRTTIRYLGMVAAAAPALAALPARANPSAKDLYLPMRYEHFSRGEIHSLDPKTRGLVIIWRDKGRVKLKASDFVVKTTSGYPGNAYSELKVGQTVDVHWYDYVDFLLAKTSPAATAEADQMVVQGARIETIPGSEHSVRLFKMTGMVTRTDVPNGLVYIINASSGEPDRPAPDSGEVIQLPRIQTDTGKAALAALKAGDHITAVFNVETARTIAIVR